MYAGVSDITLLQASLHSAATLSSLTACWTGTKKKVHSCAKHEHRAKRQILSQKEVDIQ